MVYDDVFGESEGVGWEMVRTGATKAQRQTLYRLLGGSNTAKMRIRSLTQAEASELISVLLPVAQRQAAMRQSTLV